MNKSTVGVAVLSLFATMTVPRGASACTTGTICYTDNTAGATIWGQTTSNTGGQGVAGYDTGTSELGLGVSGASIHGVGGSFGSDDFVALYAVAGTTVPAAPSGLYGVYSTASGTGAIGIYGTSAQGNAVYGVYTGTGSANGVQGSCTGASGNGVYGFASGAGQGVSGDSDTGIGVYGKSTSGTGIFGDNRLQTSGGNAAVNGQTADPGGYGGYFANSGTGGNDYAGYFSGNVTITGNLTVDNIDMTGSCTGNTCSDERLKQNIRPLDGTKAIEQLLSVHGVMELPRSRRQFLYATILSDFVHMNFISNSIGLV